MIGEVMEDECQRKIALVQKNKRVDFSCAEMVSWFLSIPRFLDTEKPPRSRFRV